MVNVTKRIVRLVIFSLSVSIIILLLINVDFQSINSDIVSIDDSNRSIIDKIKFNIKSKLSRDEIVEQNYSQLQKLLKQPIGEPKVKNLVPPPANPDEYERANATLTVLVRNKELLKVISTIKQIESKFNNKYHYPYVFLNDEKFTDKFKERILKVVSGEAYFETIDKKIWNQPSNIDKQKQHDSMNIMNAEGVGYAKMISYHNMCRYYSMNFFNHPRMKQFKYYWRFEPGTHYYCDINYDVFKFMQSNNKKYGFTIALYDVEQSVRTLWPSTLEFLEMNPHYLNENSAIKFLTENLQNPHKTEVANGYSTCHFWSNFEIADMDFYRDEAYTKWVEYLDSKGGFYYERWGDAPVHSIGLSLFADKKDIHWFRDIGYKHDPYTLCSDCPNCKGCVPGDFTYKHLRDQNCLTNWWNLEMDDEDRNLY
ncbi:glycosyltransferase family 15 protein [[Candida] arabinofermentans NRRL YB-2248]|uniref:Glycosyltransferase family 15 protein n=1 Tax=[Candida] arabinofermentans NRRL YB-2248 TaxID=983967 RepID=A0A1E4T1K9_9ASCO|nr:glycosyltransferase family 15 protein [[Candida] arabinofermentans NRRL YB-2248]